MTHVVLDVWLASPEQQDPAGLVVPVLAAEVEGREPAPVLDVEVGLGPAEGVDGLAVALPGRLVEGSVAVLEQR